ncbi:MAG: SapC family protein [Proteobacteria bacterium]|nr:SapC family protein [Pseudomonadota bacterium]HQR02633.1 SapC family protein [Rhodocyclaceae bacterium]
MRELLFYKKITPIDKTRHRNLKIGEIKEYRFAAKTNAVPLATVEFFETAKEYPIVFPRLATNQLIPAALVGLRDSENLLIDSHGSWDARYIPAFVRRFPFVLAEAEDNQMLVCIDEDHPSIGSPKGYSLFDEQGEPTPFLASNINFMKEFQTETLRTREFVDRLAALDLFRTVEARADLKEGGSFQLGGLSVIDETRYRELDKDTVDELFRKGWLALIDAHLLSLGNLSRLVDRLSQARIR